MAHGRKHGAGKCLASIESGLDLTSKVIRVVGELNILTHVAFLVHKGAEAISRDVHKGVLHTLHERDVSGVGGRNNIFILLASENVNGGEVALGVTVLSSLGCGNSGDLAWVLCEGIKLGKGNIS